MSRTFSDCPAERFDLFNKPDIYQIIFALLDFWYKIPFSRLSHVLFKDLKYHCKIKWSHVSLSPITRASTSNKQSMTIKEDINSGPNWENLFEQHHNF